ncbi:cysteine-rich receptor-like protein kinase 2 isoform X2 [Ipomoea triloba]|uniref:cysteine-rich receptor-like protein kinase 2 isoform X2 n=1 Tax=Ipomoea triloba TaxID=35885 RepID=UPI00125E8209|nr:cysteine-rich receptor-like protein kinase 2 isoform X2 [Ipomoea triloba]
MKKTFLFVPLILVTTLVLLDVSNGVTRPQTIRVLCGPHLDHNTTTFSLNFIALMENLMGQMRTQGWGFAKIGEGPDTNFGLAQCYGGYVSLLDRVLCYNEAHAVLPNCYPSYAGRIYLDSCFVRIDNYSFFGENLGPEDTHVCGNGTRKDVLFQAAAKRAMLQAVSNAPKNVNGFAGVELPISGRHNSEFAYVLANCWKTVNTSGCRRCLESASKSMLKCLPWSEGRALYTGCFMRYSASVVLIVLTTVTSVTLSILGLVIGFYIWKQKRLEKKRKGLNDAKNLVKTLHDSSLNFKYSTLEKATGSFDDAKKLGQGGYGIVYKGVMVDGREIAVKRLFFDYKFRAADFYNEVNIICQVQHKNLVKLLGCSCSGRESLLVYEFMPNQSLDRYIFDPNKGKCLHWKRRLNIIIGITEGLVYLNENSNARIIHRDIKASNILLDDRFRAKIADFGLARSFQEDKSHISTAIARTLGYMAPEYFVYGKLTEKVDVYSFGVLLLEIVMGVQNNKSTNTECWASVMSIAWRHFQEGTVEELFDLNLMLHNCHDENVKIEILRVVHIGLLCTQEVPFHRPSMSMVLQMLLKKEELPHPSSPPFDEKTLELNHLQEGNFASNATISHSSLHPR